MHRGARGGCEFVLLVILAFIFPPVVALIERGCSGALLLNIILTILGWLPGIVHAIYLIIRTPEPVLLTAGEASHIPPGSTAYQAAAPPAAEGTAANIPAYQTTTTQTTTAATAGAVMHGGARGILEIILLIILAIIFPPIVALIERGCSGALLLNIILTILGWLPGVIHAIYLIFSTPAPTMLGGSGGGSTVGGTTYQQTSTTTTATA